MLRIVVEKLIVAFARARRGLLPVLGAFSFVAILASGTALASGPSSNRILNYQLRLTDSSGIPVADGTKSVKLTFYTASSGGTQLYSACTADGSATGTPAAVTVTFANGAASVLIGDTGVTCASGSAVAIPATLFDSAAMYLGVTVNADAEMTPRKRVVAAGYALNADKLDDLDTSNAGGSGAFVPVTDSSGNFTLTKNVTVDTNTFFVDATNNRVGVGTASPSVRLEVTDSSSSGNIWKVNGTNSAYGSIGVDSQGRTSFFARGEQGAGSFGGAYFTADGYEEGWMNVVARASSTGARFVRFGTKSGQFRLDLLNDAGTVIVTQGIFSISNSAPANSLYIDSSGNTGIGTSSLSAKLTVAGGITASGTIATTVSSGSVGLSASNGVDSTIQIVPVGSGQVRFRTDFASRWMSFADGTGGTDVLTVRSGSVGVGDTTPDALLDVAGTFQYDGNGVFGDASGDTVTSNAAAWTFANDTTVALSGGVNGINFDSDTLSIDATNNRVGIGTASPSQALHINGSYLLAPTSGNSISYNQIPAVTNYAQFVFNDHLGTYRGYLGYIGPSAGLGARNDTVEFGSNARDITIRPNETEVMRFTSGGNVGIGDASPASLLTVGSGDLFQVDSSGRVFAPSGASGAGNLAYSFVGDTDTGLYRSAANEVRLQTAGSDRVTFDANGRVGINDTTPSYKLDIDQGNVTNEYAILLHNLGAGTTGMRFEPQAGGVFEIGGTTGTQFVVSATNRTMYFTAANSAYDNSPQAFLFSQDSSTPGRPLMVLRSPASTQVADLQNWQASDSTHLASIASSGALTVSAVSGGFGRYENRLVRSEELDNASWTKTNASIGSTSGTAPDGSATAERVDDDATTGNTSEVTQAVTTGVSASDVFTFSVWIKNDTVAAGNTVSIKIRDDGTVPATTTNTITMFTGATGWQRYAVQHTASSGSTQVTAVIDHGSVASDRFFAWGAQLEEQSSVGVYIATTSATVSTGRGLVLNSSTGATVTGNLTPSVDNTYDLGTSSLRWKSLHTGPGSVVVHNDATNTQKLTLDFSGANASRIASDSTSTLQLTSGSNTGIYVGTNGRVGFGTTSLSYELNVAGTSPRFMFDASGTRAWVVGTDTTPDSFFIQDYTSGVRVLNVAGSTARVGINTTGPATRLEVMENTNSNAALETLAVTRSRADSTAPGAADFGADITYRLEGFTDGSNVLAGRIRGAWEAAQANDTTDRDSYLSFATMANNSLAEAMRISSTGNVGIGATSTGSRLDVLDVSNGADVVRIRGSNSGTGIGQYHQLTIINQDTSANTTVGIGLQHYNASSAAVDAAVIDATLSVVTAGSESGNLRFSTRNAGTVAERMRIDNAGNVGIGDASPASLLTVGDGDDFQVSSVGAVSTTIANTANAVGLTVTQNDTTNNPRGVSIVNTGTAASLFIDPNGNASSSTSTGGAILLENTGNSGAGMVIYSNNGAGTNGRLLVVRADNASYDTQPVYIENDGTSHAVSVVQNSTGSTASGITVVSTNPNDTAVGITGQETGKGTLKVTHNYTGTADTSAAAISILLGGTSGGTAAQGIFMDSTASQPTTGKLLNLRNNGTEYLTLTGSGNLGLGDTTPAALLTVGNGDLFQVSSSGNVSFASGATRNISILTAASGASGNTLAIAAGAGGTASTAGTSGGSLTLSAGAATAGVTTDGGAGGNITLTATSGTNAGFPPGGQGGAGGAFTFTAGGAGNSDNNTTGAVGGGFTFAGGVGGSSNTASGTAGTGGGFTVTLGAGGAGTNGITVPGGVGGAFALTTGTGGAGDGGASGGASGALTLTVGTGGAGSGTSGNGGAAGTISILGGTGGAGGSSATSGAGGNIVITAGNAGTGAIVGGNGGNITLTAGNSNLGGTSGDITLDTGSGGSASGKINFKIAGTTKMTLDASGRLGIGDTTPDATLDVTVSSTSTSAAAEIAETVTFADTGVVTTGTDRTYGTEISVTRTGATGGTIISKGANILVTGDAGGTSTTTGLEVTVSGADTNYAAIFSGGNVGIGTTAPSTRLEITDSASAGDLVKVNGTNSAYGTIGVDSSGRSYHTARGEQGNGTAGGAYFTADGYEEGWMNVVARTNTGDGRYMRVGTKSDVFRLDSLNDAGTSVVTQGIFSFSNFAPANTLYANSSGQVGIGTAAPAARLDVKDPSANTGVIHVGSTFTGGDWKAVKFGDGDFVTIGERDVDDQMNIRAATVNIVSGVFGMQTFGTSTASGVCYSDVSRTIEGTASTTIHTLSACTSSRKYKENITPLNVDIDKLLQLQPVDFDWKPTTTTDEKGNTTTFFGTGPSVGLIAEDVETLMPEIVTYKDGQVDGLEYKLLTVYELAALKDLYAKTLRLDAAGSGYAIGSSGVAAAAEPAKDSKGLSFSGSSWDAGTNAAVVRKIGLSNVMTDKDAYRLSVKADDGAEVAYFGSTGDLAIKGRLYPSDRGAMQNSRYIYYDGSEGLGGDFMRTNAAGWATGSYDFAEMFPSDETLVAGELVMVDPSSPTKVKRAAASADGTPNHLLVGIISTRPGFLAGMNDVGSYPVALQGRVPTKVTGENGPIAVGDPITVSSVAGAGMKATSPGYIVGIALESFDGNGSGSVSVFVRPGWWDGAEVVDANDTPVFTAGTAFLAPLDLGGQPIVGVGAIEGLNRAWSIDADGKMTMKDVTAEKFSVKQTDASATIDSATIPSGNVHVQVHNAAVAATSRVFVTFRKNPKTAWWVDEVTDGLFVVRLDLPAVEDLTFDYWLVGVVDERTPVAPQVTAPLPTPSVDTDGEGLSDGQEATLGTNPLSSDTDLDGFTDSVEVETGHDPLAPVTSEPPPVPAPEPTPEPVPEPPPAPADPAPAS